MYKYVWDEETGGLLLTVEVAQFSKEPRPVYFKELDILGFDKYWHYPKDDHAPLMWAEANNYIYKGRNVARVKGGSLYTAPEIIILDDPEPNAAILQFVDIEKMIVKNESFMETLEQEAIQKIYNVYRKYKNKVDIFYVAFSGGKDSIVSLDLVQKSLPHDNFWVIFGDTGMEFSDTYDVVDKVRDFCNQKQIRFIKAQSHYKPIETWNLVGPPAQKMRWCCGVHKTAPQILLLRKLTKNPRFRGMAIMGVRADESVSRSHYSELNFGTKHQGQYDFYPIFHWNSAEVFLYIYRKNLLLNETYKKGNSRAGCLVCPMEATKNTWFKEQSYSSDKRDCLSTSYFRRIIIDNTFAKELSVEKQREFLNVGAWRSRHNGSKLAYPRNIYHEEIIGDNLVITLDTVSTDWRQWLKTIGELNFVSDQEVEIFCDNNRYRMKIIKTSDKHIFTIRNSRRTKKEILFISWIKIVLKKSAYCICCQICEANCQNGYIHMKNKTLYIDDKCIKCKKCYKVDGGCIVAASQLTPKEAGKMNGTIDQYKNMGIRYTWVVDYLKKRDEFWNDNGLGSVMITKLKLFLRHAGVINKNKITNFGEFIANLGGESITGWALMICNLVYTPQFNWWVMNIEIDRTYFREELEEMLKKNLTYNSMKNVIRGFRNIFYTNPILSREIGFGIANISEEKHTLESVYRSSWQEPDPKVILYSLYKFAENCGDYYQFSLTTLLDDSIERDGISPTRIFGLSKEMMIPLLNGLAMNYPNFISASFSLGLDTITLNQEKTSQDILQLF